MTSILVGFGIALVVAWLVLGAFVLAVRSPGQSVGEIARIFPNSVRLAAALYRDRTLPSSVRWRLRIALIYNIQPVNLIPDAIPVIGLADNVAVLLWALRSTVRIAGADSVRRHWKGSPASLATLYRALRLSSPPVGLRSPQPLTADASSSRPTGST
ncbi:MAG: YkvA family protein [Gaiellaceae bacterium]